MTFTKKLAAVGGMVVLVGAAYVGFGTVTTEHKAVAEDKMMTAGGGAPDFTTDEAQLGYAIGAQIAQDMKRSNLQSAVDLAAMKAAFDDVFSGTDLRMTPEAMQMAQQKYQQKLQDEYAAKVKANADASAAFMAENGKKSGIVTTDSGLQYKVVREGKGKQPAETDTVKVHYEGKLADGTKFDSSYDRGQPADFPVRGVIPGFSEGLMAMKEGAKYTLYIPADQAYGENAPASIGPNQALIFEVELIEVLGDEEVSNKKPS
ncbi:MAG: FKBP-type peptidyl-prolyl cis-trans isomerase [Gammaproteobacteria bacterium]|nr:FKBP-type peptidyl-prolyl cis-trans isomerase [Gammaproteobacteria bacterium]